jgi:4'-phosphopantetheinyl transferase
LKGPRRNPAAGERAPLPSGVEVHLCQPEQLSTGDLDAAFHLLSSEERACAERFVFGRDRAGYIAAHALLRRALGSFVGCDESKLEFAREEFGRPVLSGRNASLASFSLSHTRGLVGCALTAGSALGFDLERTHVPAPLEVADRYFSCAELRELGTLAPAQQHERFYQLWTLKEAYLKARGVGLSMPLAAFSISIRAPHRAEMQAYPPDDRSPHALHTSRLGDHWVAVAKRGCSTPLLVHFFTHGGF